MAPRSGQPRPKGGAAKRRGVAGAKPLKRKPRIYQKPRSQIMTTDRDSPQPLNEAHIDRDSPQPPQRSPCPQRSHPTPSANTHIDRGLTSPRFPTAEG